MRAYAILIPARLASTRLPDKLLLAASGKPLIQHVVERATEAPGDPRVLVCTDDERIRRVVVDAGFEARMTRADHTSGTDRCAEVAATLDEAVVVNLQGDEPLVAPEDLHALAEAAREATVGIATLGYPFRDAAQRADENAVKAIRDVAGFALGFQRADPGPASRALDGRLDVLHHVGLYAFRRDRLLAFAALPPTKNERRERLEQLRALDNGWRIRVLDASRPAFGIDTQQDYDAFLAHLAASDGAAG